MKFFYAMTTLLTFGLLTEASLIDTWQLQKVGVSETFAMKADGTKIPVPRSTEVLLKLELITKKQYGSRDSRLVLEKEVVPASNGIAQIRVIIEDDAAYQCRTVEDGGMTLAMLGPHDATVPLVVAPGLYEMIINGFKIGNIEVGETEASFTKDQDYPNVIASATDDKIAQIFGRMVDIKIEKDDCSFASNDAGQSYLYSFKSSSKTLDNGDILTKPELSGAFIPANFSVRNSCSRVESSLSLTFTASDKENTLTLGFIKNRKDGSETKWVKFTRKDRSCSKGL